MALKCSVLSCGNTSNLKGSDAVSFFEFPSTPTRKQNWLDIIGRPALRPVRSARVCSKHFDEKYFVLNGDQVALKKDAVPFPLKRRQNTREVQNPPIGIKRPRRNTVFIGSYNYDSKRQVPDSSSQNKPSIEQRSSNAVNLSAIATQRQRNTTISANNLYSKSVAHENTQTTHHSSNLPITTLPPIYSNQSSIGSNHPPQRPVISRNDVRPIVSNENRRPSVSKVTNKTALLPITMNQLSIDTFFRKKTTSLNQLAAIEPRKAKREDCIFGWILLGSHPVPYIVQDSERFCSLRMLEKFSLAKFKKQTPKIGPCAANIQSFLVTLVQCDLLNEINSKHCDNLFGKVKFSMTEKLVRLHDAEKYHTFVHLCRKPAMKSRRIHSEGLNFGFTLVNTTSFIPYIILNERKFIPLKYLHCDEQIIYKLKGKTQILSDDDALYLKFCYKFDGIENVDDDFEVIELIEIQKLAPRNTTFKDCWPMGDEINEDLRLMLTTKGISFKSIKRNAIKWRSSQPA